MENNIERLQFKNTKDLLTEMSKNTYTDIDALIKGRECTHMSYEVEQFNDADNIRMTVLYVVVSGDHWKASDTLMYIHQPAVSDSNVKKVVLDMANYYKKNVLKL